MRNPSIKTLLAALAAIGSAVAVDAAVVRKLPEMSVVENETVSTDSMKATSVRSSNSAVFSAALREEGEAVVNGLRIGGAELSYVGERGVFATRPVMVVPAYWDVLRRMFSDDPEITVDIVGDKVVVGGTTANVETLRRVEQAKTMDAVRIVAQVTYSTAQIGELVRGFLSRSNYTNINVSVVGREVCLSGRMYDAQSIAQLKSRVEGFVKEFPGVTVNSDELRIIKQKIMIGIEFIAYNSTMKHNLGIEWPSAVGVESELEFGFDHDKNSTDTRTLGATAGGGGGGGGGATTSPSKETTLARSWTGKADVKVTGLKATINLLESAGAAKKMYSTTLSTQSGIQAEFQNGGTVYMQTSDLYKTDMKEIEYGYIIKTTPLIIDENTINLDFDLDLKQDGGRDGNDYKVERYQTKSKYLVRPGESIVLSGYKHTSDGNSKTGLPWFAKIPWLGERLFGRDYRDANMDEMMLVVTLDWAVEDDSARVNELAAEMKGRKAEAEIE